MYLVSFSVRYTIPNFRSPKMELQCTFMFVTFWPGFVGFQGTAIIPEVWRMFHSIGRQVDYVIGLGRALQDLVRFQMDKTSLGFGGERFQPGSDATTPIVDAVVRYVQCIMCYVLCKNSIDVKSLLKGVDLNLILC